jgi:leucyl/phenylalanyl-tRNA--protein transferase
VTQRYIQLPAGRLTVLDQHTPFPPAGQALTEPDGLLAVGGDLGPQRLLDAYSQGIFPWFGQGEPILWWSPDPRMVLYPAELRISRSLAKSLKSGKLKSAPYEVRFDTAFEEVMRACAAAARPQQNGTWITESMIEAYTRLHHAGYAHSAETWTDDTLTGGVYGIAIGRMFYGESMFHHVTDASKVAFVELVQTLADRGFGLIDCQMKTAHLTSLGAKEIPRKDFLQQLVKLIHYPSDFN